MVLQGPFPCRPEALCATRVRRRKNMPVLGAGARTRALSGLRCGSLKESIRKSLQKVEELPILFGDLKKSLT